jgi:hypothetical protein
VNEDIERVIEVSPTASPLHLMDEEISDEPERMEQAEELAVQVNRIGGLLEAFEDTLRIQAEDRRKAAIATLVRGDSHDPQVDAHARGRIQELSWVLSLRDTLEKKRATLEQEIYALQAPPDEGSS